MSPFPAREPGAPMPRAYPSKFDRGATHRVQIEGEWHMAETMPGTVLVRSGDAAVTRAAKVHALAKIVDTAYGHLVDGGYVIPIEALPALVAKFGDRVRFREAVARRRKARPALGICSMCYADPATRVTPSHGALCDGCDLGDVFGSDFAPTSFEPLDQMGD